MPRLEGTLKQLRRTPPEPVQSVEIDTQAIVEAIQAIELSIPEQKVESLEPALKALQATLEKGSATHSQDLEKAVRALTEALKGFNVQVSSPEVNVEAIISTEELAEALTPEPREVQFDIVRDKNGFLESVVARPV